MSPTLEGELVMIDLFNLDNHMLRCLKQRLKKLKQFPTRIHHLTRKIMILKEKWGSKHIHLDDVLWPLRDEYFSVL